MNISSYSKVYNLGHRAVAELFNGLVVAQEKVDGSQFSFAKIDGQLYCRSKGKRQMPEQPDKMFKEGIEYLKNIEDKLPEGVVFRCEYLQKPKHNTLEYSRIPTNHFILFDVDANGGQNYYSESYVREWAECLGIEPVRYFKIKGQWDAQQIKAHLKLESQLGGQKVEGLVFKNYDRFDGDKKTLMGKYVSESFKEVNQKNWKAQNNKGIIDQIRERYCTEARWQKAIQHLKEEGLLTNSSRDIGPLIDAVWQDTKKECEDELKEMLFKHFWKSIKGGLVKGFPQWYKDKLLWEQFDDRD